MIIHTTLGYSLPFTLAHKYMRLLLQTLSLGDVAYTGLVIFASQEPFAKFKRRNLRYPRAKRTSESRFNPVYFKLFSRPN